MATPELHSDEAIESDPLPPGQVWATGVSAAEGEPGLFRPQHARRHHHRRFADPGRIDLVPNAARIAELAVDKQAQTLLMPISARRQLNDLPDDLWTRISIEFYKDVADAVFKSLVD